MSEGIYVPGIEGVVRERLREIEMTSGQAYSAEALKNATPPFNFYRSRADDEEYCLDGYTGLLSADFDVHCVAITYAQIVALCGATRSALRGLQGETHNGLYIEQVIVKQASPDLKEKEVGLYRRMFSLQIKFQEV